MNTFTTISISLNVNGVLDLENSFYLYPQLLKYPLF